MTSSKASKISNATLWLDIHVFFLIRRKIASFTLRHWKGVLWSGEIVIAATALLLFRQFFVAEWNVLNMALTVLFGIATVTSLIISITVLHIVRDTITDYTEAGEGLRKVIMGARQTLFLLSENPAFLQVLHRDGMNTYYEMLRTRLIEGSLKRVVFAYVNRDELIGKKLPKWAGAAGESLDTLIQELFSNLSFNLGTIPQLKGKVFFVPLKTDSLPFFIAVADDDRMAMFCRQKIDDSDILRKSIFRGFLTVDPYITRALRSMYLKTIELDAIAYAYKCQSCKVENKISDHDLLQWNVLTATNASTNPQIKCPACGNSSSFLRNVEISTLALMDKENYFAHVLGAEIE